MKLNKFLIPKVPFLNFLAHFSQLKSLQYKYSVSSTMISIACPYFDKYHIEIYFHKLQNKDITLSERNKAHCLLLTLISRRLCGYVTFTLRIPCTFRALWVWCLNWHKSPSLDSGSQPLSLPCLVSSDIQTVGKMLTVVI